MEKMLWLQKHKAQFLLDVDQTTGQLLVEMDPDLLLDSWFRRVEKQLWFFFPIFITLKASSELFTWTQRRSATQKQNEKKKTFKSFPS